MTVRKPCRLVLLKWG